MVNTSKEFLHILLMRTVETAIGPSALRNQGSGNVISITRQFLGNITYKSFVTDRKVVFQKELDKQTMLLVGKLPARARNWGAARKALNLMLRDILYNQYLQKQYQFNRIGKFLELPLDQFVAKGIINDSTDELPKWKGIKYLTATDNDRYQNAASVIATAKKIQRIHLDAYYWRNIGKTKAL
jgi:hypothetical protein